MKNKDGFTLVELLVVVLIISILAAIALPQYQKAAEKAKATQALVLLKAVGDAGIRKNLATGSYPTAFEELDITLPPWLGATYTWPEAGAYHQVRAGEDWNIVFGGSSASSWVRMERLTGSYRGAGFQWQWFGTNTEEQVPKNKIICVEEESPFKKAAGSYCQNIFKGTKTPYPGPVRVYKLP